MRSSQLGSQHEYLPGAVGPFLDELPLLTHATIKPYVIAILLHRGAVSFNEIITALSPHCAQIDTKVGYWDQIENYQIEDKTRLEMLAEEVLGEMVANNTLRYNEELDIWVLSLGENRRNLPTIINWISSTGGRMPQHLICELAGTI